MINQALYQVHPTYIKVTKLLFSIALQAWYNDAEDTMVDKVFPIGSKVYFYVEPPTGIHAGFTVIAGDCKAGEALIESTWLYGLNDADCNVDSDTFANSAVFGACMHIFASKEATTTISCTATLAFAE